MSSKKVVTVTLNPSLDRTIITHYLSLGYHNHVTDTTRLHPAGRGMNIARALHNLDVQAHAIVVLGDDANGAAYRALMGMETLPVTFVAHAGSTRSNVTILDTGNQQETHVIEKSQGLEPETVNRVSEMLAATAGKGDFVVFAGSLPDEAPHDTYARMMPAVRAAGGVIVLSVTSEALAQGIDAGPDVLVITQQEMEGYFNHPVRTTEDVLYCGAKLLEKDIDQVLAILSDGQAQLITAEGAWHLAYQEDVLGTQTGVKDAVLAGYLAGRAGGLEVAEALELGGAAAVYTSGQIGSEFGSMEDMEEFSGDVDVSTEEEETGPVTT